MGTGAHGDAALPGGGVMNKNIKLKLDTIIELYCPECDAKLVVRVNRSSGNQFLGCSNWPDCVYTRPIPEEYIMRASGQSGLFDV